MVWDGMDLDGIALSSGCDGGRGFEGLGKDDAMRNRIERSLVGHDDAGFPVLTGEGGSDGAISLALFVKISVLEGRAAEHDGVEFEKSCSDVVVLEGGRDGMGDDGLSLGHVLNEESPAAIDATYGGVDNGLTFTAGEGFALLRDARSIVS